MDCEVISSSKLSSPEYIVLDEDDNEIKLNDSPEAKKRKIRDDEGDAKKKEQKCRFDLRKVPTLLPMSDLRVEDFNKEAEFDAGEMLKEWKEQTLDELLLVDEHPFKDPMVKKLSPHESYAYLLGLNLVLENVTNSYKNSLNWLSAKHKKQLEKQKAVNEEKQQPEMSYNLHLGIENEEEFLKNLEVNAATIKTLNKTLGDAQSLKHKCSVCEFRTDSLHILDQHLTHPHNLNSKSLVTYRDTFTTLKCNFCEDFRTYLKDEYAKHIHYVHRRKFVSIKPNCAYNCHLCDYECREKLRFQRHVQTCPNNNEEFLKNVQKPTTSDDFEYECMFPTSKFIVNRRPIHPDVRSVNRLTSIHADSINQRPLINSKRPPVEFSNARMMQVLGKQSGSLKNSSIQPNVSGMNMNVLKHSSATNLKPSKQSDSSLFPKFLICPVCNISISNIIDLSRHLRQTHKFNENTTNTIINERVIPQLQSKICLLKEKAPQPVINITNAKKTSPNTITQIIRPNNQYISKTINFNTMNGASKAKLIDYVTELKLTNNFLKIAKQIDGKLNEVKTIAGKCFLCEHKTVYDLLQHFKYQHDMSIGSKRFETLCILCGNLCCSREELISHQYQSHKVISFVSLNKVFTLSKIENTENEIKEIESRLLELKQTNNSPPLVEVLETPKKVAKSNDELPAVKTEETLDPNAQGSTTRKYTCNQCTMIFEDFYVYCSHLINAHRDSIKSNLKCPICKNYFHCGQPYQNHIRTHLKICQIEVKRLTLDKPRPVLKVKAENGASLLKMKQKNSNLNIKDIQIVLSKLNPAKNFVNKKTLSSH